jgi:AraC family transcriptional regulator
MNAPLQAPYQDRVFRVIDHIYANPGADLRLDELADMAAMSRFHWHRVFRAVTGETLAEAVRRIRMGQAAYWLISTGWPMDQVARASGYPNLQSFTRTFAETHGLPPAAYRKRGALVPGLPPKPKGAHPRLPVLITNLPARRLAALAHKGAYQNIGASFEKAAAVFATRNLGTSMQGLIGVFLDDPAATNAPALRSHAGVIVSDDFVVPPPLAEVLLPGGRHAVMTYKGPYAGLSAAYDYLYASWLPGSGHDVGASPVFEHYLNSPADTPPEALLTDVCLPLA